MKSARLQGEMAMLEQTDLNCILVMKNTSGCCPLYSSPPLV